MGASSIDGIEDINMFIIAAKEVGQEHVTPFILIYKQIGMELIKDHAERPSAWINKTAIRKTQDYFRGLCGLESQSRQNKEYELS